MRHCIACRFDGIREGLTPGTVAWAEEHERAHLAKFPLADQEARASLRRLVESAERRERQGEERVS